MFIYNLGAVAAGLILLQQIQGRVRGSPGGWQRDLAKFQLFDFSFSIARSFTFWAGVIGGAFLTTSTHGTDQYMVSALSVRKEHAAGINALLTSESSFSRSLWCF